MKTNLLLALISVCFILYGCGSSSAVKDSQSVILKENPRFSTREALADFALKKEIYTQLSFITASEEDAKRLSRLKETYRLMESQIVLLESGSAEKAVAQYQMLSAEFDAITSELKLRKTDIRYFAARLPSLIDRAEQTCSKIRISCSFKPETNGAELNADLAAFDRKVNQLKQQHDFIAQSCTKGYVWSIEDLDAGSRIQQKIREIELLSAKYGIKLE